MAEMYNRISSFSGTLFEGNMEKLIAKILKARRPKNFFLFNVQHYVYFWQDKRLSSPDVLIINDSRVFDILWRWFLRARFSLIPGWDFLPLFLRQAESTSQRIYFLLTNDSKDVFLFLKNYLRKKYPQLSRQVKGETIPYTQVVNGTFNSKEIIARTNKSKADVVLVGWGAPFGHRWILNNRKQIKARSLVEIGGAVDFLLGFKKKPPRLLIKLGLGWFWRLLNEPHLWRRYFLHDTKILRYFIMDISQKLKR